MPRSQALQAYVSRVDEIRRALDRQGGSQGLRQSTVRFLGRIQRRLTRPPRVAIVGEVNTGKTSLANLLIGRDVLNTDVVHNTRAPILIRYADTVSLSAVEPDGTRSDVVGDAANPMTIGHAASLELCLPLPILKRFEIIDTPGVSMFEDNSERMAYVCRQADMAIWCTLATQAWRSSERELWHQVCQRTRSRSLLAVTHADALTLAERARVEDRLQREAGAAFAGLGMVSGLAAPGEPQLAAAFVSKVEAALDAVEQQRLTGARHAVLEFSRRLGGSFEAPDDGLRAAS